MLRPGDPAPDFTIPAAHAEGTVSLGEYRGCSALLLALFRGLYCPFCRRQMAQLGLTAAKLRPLGVETLGVVATAADRARAYFRLLPVRLPFGSDPDLATHRAYGLGHIQRTPEAGRMVEDAALQLALDLGVRVVPGKARETIDRLDGYVATESDMADRVRHQIQLTGQFLIDRDGTIRWASSEERAAYASFPADIELMRLAADL